MVNFIKYQIQKLQFLRNNMKKIIGLLAVLLIAGVAKAQKDSSVQQAKFDTTLFTMVEINPQFPGGQAAMDRFIDKNLNYPSGESKQGRVIVDFVVERNGSLTDIKVVRGLSEAINAEAVRLVSSFPNWIPGMQNGRKARVYYSIPIKFISPD